MNALDTAHLLAVAHGAMDDAVNFFVRGHVGEVRTWGDRDLVTEARLAVEHHVRDHLRENAPGIGFLGKETGAVGDQNVYWVLDPVNGITNFVRGVPLCAATLGLVCDGQTVLGVIDTPFLGHRYWATRGNGAFRDGYPIAPSGTAALEESLISIGDHEAEKGAATRTRARAVLEQALSQRAQQVRRIGSSAVELAWVADGTLDASLMLKNRGLETAAGAIIAREAGALVVDADGRPHSTNSPCAIAMTPGLRDVLLPLVCVVSGTQRWPASAATRASGSVARSGAGRAVGATAFLATIGVGIGDDDTADTVAEKEFSSPTDARSWIEHELPVASFPAWVSQRPRGSAGVFLFGAVQRGDYVPEVDGGIVWQPDENSADDLEAYLVGGQVRWRGTPGTAV